MPSLVEDNVLICGHRIACAALGEGEPVALIHGTPSSSYIWRNVAPKLEGAGHRVHLFDLLGFGASERPLDSTVDTSVSGQVPILQDLMSHWGLEHAHIVAHDIGGAVAQRFCLFHPNLVRTLTLIDTVSFDSWPSKRTNAQMEAGLDALIRTPESEHRAHFREWLLSTVEQKEAFASGPLETYIDLISGPVGQASLFQYQVAHYDHRHTSQVSDRLAELSAMPVQILWGENDAWQVVDWAYKLQAAIPGSSLHVLRNCGHFEMEDQPERISELVISFIARHSVR